MFETCTGNDVLMLLRGACRNPANVRVVVVASPFIDSMGLRLLRELGEASKHRGFHLLVTTTPDTATIAREAIGSTVQVEEVRRLHAKLYAVLSTNGVPDEMIIGSANLTKAGLSENHELCVRIRAASPSDRAFIQRAVGWHSHVRRQARFASAA